MNISDFKIKILPRWIIITIDAMIILFSSSFAFVLRFNLDYSKLNDYDVTKGVGIIVLCGVISILITKSYAGIVRFTGMQDGRRILYTIALASLATSIINFTYDYYFNINLIPYSVIIISFLMSTVLLFTYRIAVKQVFSYFFFRKNTNQTRSIVIHGTGKSALITRQILESDNLSAFKVIAFIDEQKRHVGKEIDGIRIFNSDKDLLKLFQTSKVAELIFTDTKLSIDKKNDIVDICLRSGVKVRTIPPVAQWINGELSKNQIREIKIEELLGRETIKLNNHNVRDELKGKSVLISGAAGSIGSELARQVLYYYPKNLILVDQAETPLFELENELIHKKGTIDLFPIIADVTNQERMQTIFEEHRPDVVLHAAAYKHVPLMENNPIEAALCNVMGTQILADLALKYKAEKFVMISTDKAVNPTNVMGASKRVAELYVQSLDEYMHHTNPEATKYITTRFGNVLGSNGSVIPLFKKQIERGGPVTVTHPDIERYFMTIPEACQLVLEAGAMGNGGEIFVFDMGKSVKIVDLAKKMIRLSGFKEGEEIEIVYSGLRNGEKLFEEVLGKKEDTLPTYHHKILIAKTDKQSYDFVKKNILNLINAAYDNDELKLVGIMKFIVPEFKSKISRFEVLDNKKEG